MKLIKSGFEELESSLRKILGVKQVFVLIALFCLMILSVSSVFRVDANSNRQGSFELFFDDESQGLFTECIGVGSNSEVILHKTIGSRGSETIIKVPGRIMWGDVVLKRPVSLDKSFWNWRKEVETGAMGTARKSNILIVYYDLSGNQVAKWQFKQGWLSSAKTAFSDDGDLMEEFILVCEGEERVE